MKKDTVDTRVFLVVEDTPWEREEIEQGLRAAYPGCEILQTAYSTEAEGLIRQRAAEIDGITMDGSILYVKDRQHADFRKSVRGVDVLEWCHEFYRDTYEELGGKPKPVVIYCAGGTREDSEIAPPYLDTRNLYDGSVAKTGHYRDRVAAMFERKFVHGRCVTAPGSSVDQLTADTMARITMPDEDIRGCSD